MMRRRKRWVPRLAQANVCNAKVVGEGDVEVTVSIHGAAIEANVVLDSLEEKSTLVEGWFCFARHTYLSIYLPTVNDRAREAVMFRT